MTSAKKRMKRWLTLPKLELHSLWYNREIVPYNLINIAKIRHLPNTHCSKSSFFVQKFNFDFPEKIVDFFRWKTRENVVVLDFLAVDNFDFTRKIVKQNLGEKLVKMLGFWAF